MEEQENTGYLKGAAILAAASVFVKIIGAIYKIPLFQDGVLGVEGTADFQTTYRVYNLILTISTAGLPAALSRLVSSAKAQNNTTLVRRYFSVSMPGFFLVGLFAMLFMFFGAEQLAAAMGNSKAELGIRILSPAVLFVCIISVYRGYAQGFQNMIPTAVSQVTEVVCKAVFGIVIALWLVRLGYESHIISAGAIVGVTIGLGISVPILFWLKRRMDRALPRKVITGNAAAAGNTGTGDGQTGELSNIGVFGRILKVSIPITLTASFMSIMAVIDTGIVLRRLQSGLGLTEVAARTEYGIFSRPETLYNLTPALLVPISVSIIPAIAAALAVKKSGEAKTIMQSSVKLISLIAMPAAAGLMVLATPILTALYNDSTDKASTIMVILGAASFFVCLQYITTSILQANGHEQVSLLTFPIGAAAKITISYFLTANPDFGILASPIGTLVCFFTISTLNIIFIIVMVRESRPHFIKAFAGPALCSFVMACVAYGAFRLASFTAGGRLGSGRTESVILLGVAILAGVAAYGILIIVLRVITTEDMKLVPKGKRIGQILRVRAPKQ